MTDCRLDNHRQMKKRKIFQINYCASFRFNLILEISYYIQFFFSRVRLYRDMTSLPTILLLLS
jgi:hypothetical protein